MNLHQRIEVERLVVLGNFQGKGGSQFNGGASRGNPYMNFTSEGKSIFIISRRMFNQIGRSPHLEHIKIVVLSEELAKNGYLYDAR